MYCRCTSLRNKYSSSQQLDNSTKKNFILPLELSAGNGTVESCPSSPLFIPAKPKKKSVRRTRRHAREAGGGSTDSEGHATAKVKETSKKKRRKSQNSPTETKSKTDGNKRGEDGRTRKGAEVAQKSMTTEQSDDEASSVREELKKQERPRNVTAPQKEQLKLNRGKVLDSSQVEEARAKQMRQREQRPNGKNRDGERLRDFNGEASKAMERGPNKHKCFKANTPKAPGSDVELSSESDTILQADGEPEGGENVSSPSSSNVKPDGEQELQAQLDAMMMVLSTSDEVEQLVLRNTDLTDDLLLDLAVALKNSSSEVTLLNLNLNLIGPYGAHILLDVLRVKPQVKGLHLFGNRLRDHGVLTLLNGIAELQEQTVNTAAAIQQAMLFPSEQNILQQVPAEWSSFQVFALLELDIGGNGLGSEAIKVLASYMRHHSYLQYLGLAQTSAADLAAWKELFDSLKLNNSLSQIILDENNLGDPGVRLLADMLKENTSLTQVDLDRNGISDVGGNDIMGALLCRAQLPLRHLSLQENNISAGLMSRIQEEVKYK
ncbi:uncharacterized protein LOC131463820 [Solea solea]|uniref:uncharacterized protein LOC131463820 n=1 Tax=Solea solea TaxID=90069 RepID=UPI00272B528F|nr:uncharacterized protein LOC131463820 [Solea solea]